VRRDAPIGEDRIPKIGYTTPKQYAKKRKVSLGGLLGKVKKEKTKEEKPSELDELEQYLADR
jgi:hypothetical protein